MEYRATSINIDENRFRFYSMDIEINLFGSHILTCGWGRIGKPINTRIAHYGTYDECLEKMKEIKEIREDHNYIELGKKNSLQKII